MDIRADRQVEAVLREFATAWKRLDGEGIAACFSAAPNTTVIGTDPGEYTVGMYDYVAGWESGTYPTAAAEFAWDGQPTVRVVGGVAWAHGQVLYDLTLRSGEDVGGRMWITAVLLDEGRDSAPAWKVTHMHASYA